jgi:hypothetical protein
MDGSGMDVRMFDPDRTIIIRFCQNINFVLSAKLPWILQSSNLNGIPFSVRNQHFT